MAGVHLNNEVQAPCLRSGWRSRISISTRESIDFEKDRLIYREVISESRFSSSTCQPFFFPGCANSRMTDVCRRTGYISWHFRHVASLLFASRFGPVEAEWGAWHVMQLSSALSAVAATQTGCFEVGCPNLSLTRLSIVSLSNESGCIVTFPLKSAEGLLASN